MTLKRFTFFLLCIALLAVSACGSRTDRQSMLNAAVKNLQTALEKKDADAVLALLHPEFSGQQADQDREWARQTMKLMFLRYKNIRIVVLSQDSRVGDRTADIGSTDASVTLTGAEGLIPDSAQHYQVKLEWRWFDKQYKLFRLHWE
ncbi:MAG: hypothetical protein FWF41_04580 [Betaproteobacteria bacterium]|nr:hypothetical protein [Betaproteobacteria bacterium]